jgi:hypothetical protein
VYETADGPIWNGQDEIVVREALPDEPSKLAIHVRQFLGQPPPARVAHACYTISRDAMADEIDIYVLVRRPVALKSSRKADQSGLRRCSSKYCRREGEAVVDAD